MVSLGRGGGAQPLVNLEVYCTCINMWFTVASYTMYMYMHMYSIIINMNMFHKCEIMLSGQQQLHVNSALNQLHIYEHGWHGMTCRNTEPRVPCTCTCMAQFAHCLCFSL